MFGAPPLHYGENELVWTLQGQLDWCKEKKPLFIVNLLAYPKVGNEMEVGWHVGPFVSAGQAFDWCMLAMGKWAEQFPSMPRSLWPWEGMWTIDRRGEPASPVIGFVIEKLDTRTGQTDESYILMGSASALALRQYMRAAILASQTGVQGRSAPCDPVSLAPDHALTLTLKERRERHDPVGGAGR